MKSHPLNPDGQVQGMEENQQPDPKEDNPLNVPIRTKALPAPI